MSLNIGENEEIIREIRQNCLKILLEAASQISNRLHYIRNEFFINLSVFDATRALIDSDRDSSFVELWYFSEKFKGFDKAALKAEWRLIYWDFYSRPELDMRSVDEMWKTVLSSKYANGNVKYPQLTKLVRYIRSLPHSNAAAERTFSLLTDILTKKRNRLSVDSINAIAVVQSAVQQQEKTARTVMISDDQLSRMSSENLYELPRKEMNALNLHTALGDA